MYKNKICVIIEKEVICEHLCLYMTDSFVEKKDRTQSKNL